MREGDGEYLTLKVKNECYLQNHVYKRCFLHGRGERLRESVFKKLGIS